VSGVVTDVSRETLDAFDALERLVQRWTSSINLVSKPSLADLRQRHTLDSAQLFKFFPARAKRWADFGAGGGFPGLVIAVLAREQAPDLRVSLVEADTRKATFLRVAAAELGLRVDVFSDRIESIDRLEADVVSARALAPLPKLLTLVHRHLAPGAMAIFPKGASHEAEVTEARQHWAFDLQSHPSETGSDGAILVMSAIKPLRHS
jgi:16S rRNA (guanine527-N7)-methyltransferase